MNTREVVRSGAVAGTTAALAMILVQTIGRLTVGIPMFPDLFEDLATRAIPSAIFATILDALRFQAKPLLFAALLVVQVLAGMLLGIGFALVWGRRPAGLRGRWGGWRAALVGSLVLWLLVAVVGLPAAGRGSFGQATAVGAVALNLQLVVSFLFYGLVLASSCRVAQRTGTLTSTRATRSASNPERRRLLGGVAVGAVAALALAAAYQLTASGEPSSGPVRPTARSPVPAGPSAVPVAPTVRPVPTSGVPAAPSPGVPAPVTDRWLIRGLPAEVTPVKDFYDVSKNFFSGPMVDPSQWTLQIHGLVQKPYRLTYAELLKRPSFDRYETLTCISNEIGGNLISNATWRGVSLPDLLAAAVPAAGATKVVFTAADGYTDDLPLVRALSPANLLAYSMDGEPLVPEHGAPARLLIPGIYGMKNVKWLTQIELVNTDYRGYWEQRGWSDQATIQTSSQIDVPDPSLGPVKAGLVEVAGLAFSGDRGISKVEISLDRGKTWEPAELKPPLGPYTWRFWRYPWSATPGAYTLTVRATDGTGTLQPEAPTNTLPNGATGWHMIVVHVGG
jgi:DMSO/TMAO reductase YedYZ molybdopterin-dependent catalytic subunit